MVESSAGSPAGRGLDGVQRVGAVDGPVGPCTAGRVVEPGPDPGVDPEPSGPAPRRSGQLHPGRAVGGDVAVARLEQVAVGLLGDVVPVGDRGKEPLHRAGARLSTSLRAAVARTRLTMSGTPTRAHREQAGRVARLGIDDHSRVPVLGELVHPQAVVGGPGRCPRGSTTGWLIPFSPVNPEGMGNSPPGRRTGCRC